MKKYLYLVCLFSSMHIIIAQYEYEPSKKIPYGKYNPNAPEQVKDYKDLIGTCDCISVSRNPDQTWGKPIKMLWTWKYIMNGMAVQDETLKEDGKHSGSIRQYSKDSAQWNVHYYASSFASNTLANWTGSKKNGKIVLYRNQKAPNGMDGFSRLTFYDITDKGYKWVSEWVDKKEKFTYATWKIECVRKED